MFSSICSCDIICVIPVLLLPKRGYDKFVKRNYNTLGFIEHSENFNNSAVVDVAQIEEAKLWKYLPNQAIYCCTVKWIVNAG